MTPHGTRGGFKNTCELLNLRALNFLPMKKIRIFQCMDKIFSVEFQRYNIDIWRALRFKSLYAFWNTP